MAWRVRAEVAEVLALREAWYDRKKGKKAAPLSVPSEEGRFEGCVDPRGSSATLSLHLPLHGVGSVLEYGNSQNVLLVR